MPPASNQSAARSRAIAKAEKAGGSPRSATNGIYYQHLFTLIALIVLTAFALVLLRDGVRVLDLVALVAVASAFGLSWLLVRPDPSTLKETAAVKAALASGKPTLLEFQLDYWLACIAVRPVVGKLGAELAQGSRYGAARNIALQAALIPITNSLLAVGLVALPGMMTGQILSGVSPLLAARYQIMVMCMVYGSAGISAACFLALAWPETHPTARSEA